MVVSSSAILFSLTVVDARSIAGKRSSSRCPRHFDKCRKTRHWLQDRGVRTLVLGNPGEPGSSG